MKKLTTPELLELFLVSIYDRVETDGFDRLVELHRVASQLGIHDEVEIRNLAYYLGLKDLIAINDQDKSLFATTTSKGRELVMMGGQTGIMQRYRKNSDGFRE